MPYLSQETTVLEIAPGHGRWTNEMVEHCARLILVDVSSSCIEFCKNRFVAYDNMVYIVNDGQMLPGVANASVDFVWSFDSFVHMEIDVIESYLAEIQRVLKTWPVPYLQIKPTG